MSESESDGNGGSPNPRLRVTRRMVKSSKLEQNPTVENHGGKNKYTKNESSHPASKFSRMMQDVHSNSGGTRIMNTPHLDQFMKRMSVVQPSGWNQIHKEYQQLKERVENFAPTLDCMHQMETKLLAIQNIILQRPETSTPNPEILPKIPNGIDPKDGKTPTIPLSTPGAIGIPTTEISGDDDNDADLDHSSEEESNCSSHSTTRVTQLKKQRRLAGYLMNQLRNKDISSNMTYSAKEIFHHIIQHYGKDASDGSRSLLGYRKYGSFRRDLLEEMVINQRNCYPLQCFRSVASNKSISFNFKIAESSGSSRKRLRTE